MSLRIKTVVEKFVEEFNEALDADIQDRNMKEREVQSYIEEREREFAAREAAWKAELSRPEKVIMSKQEATKKEQVKWNEKMDSAYIQAMITQQDLGNRINGSFTSQAYANMIDEMTTKLQMSFTKDHLKNRYKTLKKSFSSWYDLLRGTSLSEFSWNAATQLIEAEDEVWENLINSMPEAASLKTRKVSNYYEMLELFARDRASGAHVETAKERNARLNGNGDIKIETLIDMDELLATNEVNLENQHVGDDCDVQVVSPTTFSPVQSSGAKKYTSKKRKVQEVNDAKVKKRKSQEEKEALNLKLMQSVDNVAIAQMEGNKIFDRAYPTEYSGEEIYTKLVVMGLETHKLPRALNFLAENQVKARTLFSCPLQIRMGVLKDMMEGNPRDYSGEEIYTELVVMGLESHELPRALNFLAENQVKARTLFSCPLQIRMDVLKDMMGARD